MSNLLECILACISVRHKHDEGIKKRCSTGISFGRSKLLPPTCDWSRIDSDIIGLVEKMVSGLQKHRLL